MILHSVSYKLYCSAATDTNAFSVFFHCVYRYYVTITVIEINRSVQTTANDGRNSFWTLPYIHVHFTSFYITNKVECITCQCHRMRLLLQPNYSVFGGCIVPCVVDSDQNSSVSTLRAEVSRFTGVKLPLRTLIPLCSCARFYSASALLAMQSAVLPMIDSQILSVWPSVCMSDRPSHAGIMPKQLQLRSFGLHWRIAPWLVFSWLTSARNSKGNIGNGAPNESGVGKIGNF